MSNAMRMGKRSLAGVAAGALALGVLTVAGAPSVSAAKSIKPKALATATASAVRPTGTGASALSIAPAKLTWKGASSFANAPATPNGATLQLLSAPSAAAIMTIDDTTATDDTASLSYNSGIADIGVNYGNSATDDSKIFFNVDTAGSYSGRIYNGTDTVSFSFATAGAPTSMTLTPATQTVLVGGVATVTVTLKDASGNTTQPQTVDSITVASSGDDTVSFTTLSGASDTLRFGTFDDTIGTQTAGTSTITATPLGTLPGSGVTAQTATVTKAGTVNRTPAKTITVTTPSNAISLPLNKDDTVDRAVQVPTNTSNVVFAIDDTTGNAAGSSLRFKLTPSAGTVTVGSASGSAASPLLVDVVTDSSRKATISATLSGAAVLGNATVTLKQVNVLDANLTTGTGVVVTQTNAAVGPATIEVSPDDSVVAKLGDTISVTVTVDDSFGNPQAGWTVASYRGTAVSGGTFINQAVTNAAGEATVTVTSAAGSTAPKLEQYSFNATPTIGSAVAVNNRLQVTYTATGEITSLNVVPLGNTVVTPNPVTNTTTAVLTAPLLTVPFDGTANSVSAQSYTVATGVNVSGGTAGEVAVFDANPSTPTPITVDVPTGSTGIFVSTTASTLWSAGKTSITVGPDDSIYVFGWKTGVHNIRFTAGGKSVTVPVKVQTSADAAYNMALSPLKQDVVTGGITTATLTVTDVFGNAVATTDDTGAVTVSAAGGVLLAGYQTSAPFTTSASGTATITVIAGNAASVGTLAATPKTGQKAAAWNTPYTKPTGAPDPTTSAAAEVTVTKAPEKQTIAIVGERTTVGGAAGIAVDGLTTGFADGDKVKPWVRFPGGSYSEGTARPVITDSEFYWERKTGKKTYVYFTNEAGDVASNRIIIPAK